MTSSSAAKSTQPEVSFEEAKSDRAPDALPIGSIASSGMPNFAYAEGARRAGRLNAAAASDDEFKALLVERKKLLDKKFDGTISKKESGRLEYVRWSLERIEDARHGHELDALESAVDRYEQFFADLQGLSAQLAAHGGGRK